MIVSDNPNYSQRTISQKLKRFANGLINSSKHILYI